MEINSPDQLMAAIKLLMMQMNREQRKQFLQWIKDGITTYNFNYPQGYKIESKEPVNEKPVEAVSAPVISVPATELILPPGSNESGGINTGQSS